MSLFDNPELNGKLAAIDLRIRELEEERARLLADDKREEQTPEMKQFVLDL